MGKKASWNPIEAVTDALDDVLSGNIFDLGEAPEVKTDGVERNPVDVGDGGDEPEPGDGDGTEEVVKPVKPRAKSSKRAEAKGEASGKQESDSGDSDSDDK